MSLVGFKARNHPQQKTNPKVDDRETAPEVFAAFDEEFHFTIDVAASDANTKCSSYFTAAEDGLSQTWAGQRVWCNPPYSNIGAWVEKARRESLTTELIVMLLPANRTEQRWWQDLVEPWRDRPAGQLSTRFLRGRTRFVAPGADGIGPNERPPFGCVLLIWKSGA